MYISDKRIKHELNKIRAKNTTEDNEADRIRLELLEDLDIISYKDYIDFLNLIELREE